ncbi:MAG TPA: Gfo/Idh/MocA family oxidoreductase [Planctomycetota bacterium]|nr:Gfo/Idh/MocA family oxidoreductase [Planctomycetota bacterium]
MSAEPLAVAVVGAGHLGRIHARILSELPGVRLAAVVDADPERARAVAKERRCPALIDASQLPADVRAAVVATPTRTHHAVAGPLLDRGVACLVEKPITATVAEARDLVDRAARSGATLMAGHVERFNPAVIALMERGLRPRFFEAHRVSPFSFRSVDVGVVLDMMIHDLDIVLHLARSPLRRVDAVGVAVTGEHEDLANARLEFENGAVANLTASRLALKTERKLRMFAPGCYATIDFFKRESQIIRPGADLKRALADGKAALGAVTPLQLMTRDLLRIEKPPVKEEESLKREDAEFLAAVRERRAPAVTGADGLAAVEAADRITASLRARAEADREPT